MALYSMNFFSSFRWSVCPVRGGQFELAKGGQFKPVLGGQFHWFFHHLVELNADLTWIQAFLGHATPDSTHIYTRNKKKYISLY